MDWRISCLEKLYHEIFNCRHCGEKVYYRAVPKKIEAVNPYSELFIISEAIGRRTERESGVAYFRANKDLGLTGRNLEKFLNSLGYTLYPPSWKDPQKSYLTTVYSTAVIKCCPRTRPLKSVIRACLEKGFLQQEIQIVKPKLILLFGKVACEAMFSSINIKIDSLWKEIERVLCGGELRTLNSIPLLPLYHPSPRNLMFKRLSYATNQKIEFLRE